MRMGTRGAYGFRKGGLVKVTYKHSDSNPTSLGAKVAESIRAHPDEELSTIFDQIIMVKSGGKPSPEQVEECLVYWDRGASLQSPDEWYSLLRKSQGNLEAYANGLHYMIDSAGFLKNTLFCAWGYVINLNEGTLEIYRGSLIQKVPLATIRGDPIYTGTLLEELERRDH